MFAQHGQLHATVCVLTIHQKYKGGALQLLFFKQAMLETSKGSLLPLKCGPWRDMHALSCNFIILVPRFGSIVQSSDTTLIYSNKRSIQYKGCNNQMIQVGENSYFSDHNGNLCCNIFYTFFFFPPLITEMIRHLNFRVTMPVCYCSVPMTSVAIKGGKKGFFSLPNLPLHQTQSLTL